MKILLTGHRGYVGKPLYERLSPYYDVTGLDLKQGDDLLKCDLPLDIDLVIHLAGKSGVRESIKYPSVYWMNNVEASRRLFNFYKNKRIVYASSSSAYEPDLNPYAASKYILEELAARHSDNLGLRLHTVYNSNPRPGMFFHKLINGTLEYTTTHHRDFIHLNDVLDFFELIIEKPHVNGVMDLGTGEAVKISSFAPNLPTRINTPGEREWTCANTEKMRALGFTPKYSVKNFLTPAANDNIINLEMEKN